MSTLTHDLGSGWEITVFEANAQRESSFATIRNENGNRIDLNSKSLETLRKIINKSGRDATTPSA